jgi:hypothetical protein
MPMLMLKCKTCGEVFPGIYVPEGDNSDLRSAATSGVSQHTCSRGHMNGYANEDYLDWS